MSPIARILTAAFVLAGLAAVIVAVLSKPKPKQGAVLPYHLTELDSGDPTQDFETKQALVDHIFFVPEAPGHATYQATKDGSAIMACCGKVALGGYWTSECCGDLECTRTTVSGGEACKAYVLARLP